MNGPEHYAAAEAVLINGPEADTPEDETQVLIMALTHAVLALTAATLDVAYEIDPGSANQWRKAGAIG